MGTPEEINTAADDPQRVSGDEGSVQERSIDEKIRAHKFAKSTEQARSKNPFAGLLFRARPPGGTGQ